MTRHPLIFVTLTLAAGVAFAQSGGYKDRSTTPTATPPAEDTATTSGRSKGTVATPGGTAGPAGTMNFGGLDTNRDGSLSRDEIKSHDKIASRFNVLDTDRNGLLSSAEFAAFERHSPVSGEMGHRDPENQSGNPKDRD